MQKTVLIVGGTGAGKSTLINMIGNYFMGGNLSNPPDSMKVLIPTAFIDATVGIRHNERNRSDRSSAQTTEVQSYSWPGLTLIDTPGFADTAGPEKDDENLLKILEFASAEPSLAGIMIVVNGTQARNTSNMQTILSRLRGLVPDVALDNIIFVVTNCPGKDSCNFSLDLIPFNPCAVVFMNNSAFSGHPREWSARGKSKILQDWKDSLHCIERLIAHVDRMSDFSTSSFKTILDSRLVIDGALKDSLASVGSLVNMENQILDIEAQVQRFIEAQNRSRNFNTTKTEYTSERYSETVRVNCSECSGHGKLRGHIPVQVMGFNGFYMMPQVVFQSVVVDCDSCDGMGYENRTESKSRSVPHTVQAINYELQGLFNSASRDRDKYEAILRSLKQEKAGIASRVQSIASNVQSCCGVISGLCSKFCFKDECNTLLFQSKTAAAVEKDLKKKTEMGKMIASLEKIANASTVRVHEHRQPQQPVIIESEL